MPLEPAEIEAAARSAAGNGTHFPADPAPGADAVPPGITADDGAAGQRDRGVVP